MRASLAAFLFSLASLLLFPGAARAARIDTEIEKFLGRQVAWGLVEAAGEDTDPLLLGWVRGVGARVSARAPRKDVPYTFRILGTDVANAFAAPGGHIFVTRGLLDYVESDDELASILAHESGHVSKRHATQQIGENLLFLALVSSVKGKKYDDWKTAAQLYNVLRTLAKSREMEAQADEEGIAYAAAAGYDPRGLVRFFERLGAGRGGPGRLEQYLATHPSPEKRLETAREDPLVRRDDPALRRAAAAGYAARGLSGSAAAVLRGDDPLLLPADGVRPPAAPEASTGRQAVAGQVDAVRRGLQGPYTAQQWGSRLQQILLVNSQPGDYRWVFLALRAYAVQAEAENIYERTVRLLRAAAPTYDGLAAGAAGPAGDAAAINASLGRGEVRGALEKLGGAPAPLRRASQAAVAVLADLNNPLYRLRGSAAWVRYGTLEGLLRYAESELARANKASGQAWRLLSLARVRRYEARLNELAPPGDARRRALWADLLARRFGSPPPADGLAGDVRPAGEATVHAALSVELKKPPADVGAGRGDTPWADWILKKDGIPENIATAMRLLTLDLEREAAAQDGRQTATD